jgi:hypothetical protein
LRSLSFLFSISSFLAVASNERAGKKEKKSRKGGLRFRGSVPLAAMRIAL